MKNIYNSILVPFDFGARRIDEDGDTGGTAVLRAVCQRLECGVGFIDAGNDSNSDPIYYFLAAVDSRHYRRGN